MFDMHVTVIDDRPAKTGGEISYVARCACGWKSDLLSSRPAAALAARVHRANAAVQKL